MTPHSASTLGSSSKPLPRPLLIGMVHLPPLPGSPGRHLPVEAIIAHAVRDGLTLREAGFGALMMENFGDAPFTAGSIEPVTVAAMAVAARELVAATGLPLGVNCLRNDARSALGIAAVVGAAFIRVNVHTGVAATDQGFIEGQAYGTLRERQRLCPGVRIFADVHVKHASPVGQPDIAQAAEETAYRGLADAVIVSGAATGRPVDVDALKKVKAAVPDKPVLIGSGATAANIHSLLEIADGVIVGSSLKPDGDIAAAIDVDLARAFMRAARA
jgi:membrane complex biogenesis BtpA family protein